VLSATNTTSSYAGRLRQSSPASLVDFATARTLVRPSLLLGSMDVDAVKALRAKVRGGAPAADSTCVLVEGSSVHCFMCRALIAVARPFFLSAVRVCRRTEALDGSACTSEALYTCPLLPFPPTALWI
jgi:hypothetical protein